MAYLEYANAAPLVRRYGIKDNSPRRLPATVEQLPSHLPKIYLYAQKGPAGPQLVDGNERQQLYGDATFDLQSPFVNHATVLSNALTATPNAQMIERVFPADIGPKANFLLSLDILPTTVPQYQRDASGKVLTSLLTGLPVLVTPAVSLPGFKAKWVLTSVASKIDGQTDADLFGNAEVSDGDQVDGQTQSTRYPMLQFWASSEGELFNDSGLRLWAPTVTSTGGVNQAIMTTNKVYPFRIAAVRRPSPRSSPVVVETEDGTPFFDFTLKPGQINPATKGQYSLHETYLQRFQTLNSKLFADKYADLGNFKIYDANVAAVLALTYGAEKAHLNALSDFTGAAGEEHLFNLFSGTSSNGARYYTYTVDTEATNSVRLSEGTTLYASGGSNGTMSDDLFSGLVGGLIAQYADPQSYVQETAEQVESVFYDTGFNVVDKFEIAKFIAERKDTAVFLSTHVANGPTLDAAEEHSLAVALRTRLQLYPESEYYGTSTRRGVIIGRSAQLIDSLYTRPLPLTIEVAVKAAQLAGAGNGIWDAKKLFDRAPGSEIKLFHGISIGFTPANQRVADWEVGLNYPVRFTRKTDYFPALKTVCDDDTSVLNSIFPMMVCQELQKIGERTHRKFSGVLSLSPAQLVDEVNKDVRAQVVGRFANLVTVIPNAFISGGDEVRGYSWTLNIEAYFNTMRTAMALSLIVDRTSALTVTP